MHYSPIALFIYNRPEHTRRTLESLMRCDHFSLSPLYIFCDGAKDANDKSRVEGARAVARSLAGSRAEYVESGANQGLADSIIAGVSRLCRDHGRVIVVEDDLLVSGHFLGFLNEALIRYENEAKVAQVSAYMFPVEGFAQRTEAFFLPFTSSWGWATWKRAWDLFDGKASGWEALRGDEGLRRRFNLEGAYDYYSLMKRQMSGAIDSWAIRWYWSVFRAGGLTLFPPRTLVRNIGFDGSGTHGWRSAKYLLGEELPEQRAGVRFPGTIAVDEEAFAQVRRKLRTAHHRPLHRLGALLKRVAGI